MRESHSGVMTPQGSRRLPTSCPPLPPFLPPRQWRGGMKEEERVMGGVEKDDGGDSCRLLRTIIGWLREGAHTPTHTHAWSHACTQGCTYAKPLPPENRQWHPEMVISHIPPGTSHPSRTHGGGLLPPPQREREREMPLG